MTRSSAIPYTFRRVRGKVEVEFADLGEQSLKNIIRPLSFGKAEFLNPCGAVKDRAAHFIIKDAEERGLICMLTENAGNSQVRRKRWSRPTGIAAECCGDFRR